MENPTETLPKQIESIVIPVDYIYAEDGKPFPGGCCEEVCLVMLANWYYQSSPQAQQVREAQKFLLSGTIRLYFLHIWRIDARYTTYQLDEIYQELQHGRPIVAYIDGWKTMLHAIIVIGIDAEYVYYHDPALGPYQKMTHAQFQQMHQVGHYGVWRIAS